MPPGLKSKMIASFALLAFALLPAGAYDNGASIGGVSLALPPRGWSTWCTDDVCGLLDLCFEAEVRSIADAMVSQGMRRLNYSLILLECVSAQQRRGHRLPPRLGQRGARNLPVAATAAAHLFTPASRPLFHPQ